MTIILPTQLEQRLREQAKRLGIAPDDYAARLIAEHLPAEPRERSLAELFADWAAEDQTNDPAELARRAGQLEELKASMNRSRMHMEGPNARIPFP